MARDITITTEDNMGISDKSNMGDYNRPKAKLIHEQLFEQYGIDPNKVYERTGLLKTIPIDWVPDIVIQNLNSCKTQRTYENINKAEKAINVSFESEDVRKAFYREFTMNMPKSVNQFIASKNEDPKRYNRIVVVETTEDAKQITIRY